jgi:hypothetical protein
MTQDFAETQHWRGFPEGPAFLGIFPPTVRRMATRQLRWDGEGPDEAVPAGRPGRRRTYKCLPPLSWAASDCAAEG